MTNPEGQQNSTETEASSINAHLNDNDFLRFIRAHDDAEERVKNNQQLKEMMDVYKGLKTSKETLKKLIITQYGASYTSAIEGNFVQSLENLAARNPDEFIGFTQKVSTFLDSNKKLMEALQKRISESSKIEQSTESLNVAEGTQTWKNRLFKRSIWKQNRTEAKRLTEEIAQLKLSTDVSKVDIETFQAQIYQLKSDLKENEGFLKLESSLNENVTDKIAVAIQSGNHKALVKERLNLIQRRSHENLFDEDSYEEVLTLIKDQAEKSVDADTSSLVEKKDAIIINVYDKGITAMQEKYRELGLSVVEVNEKIKAAFEKKLEELRSSQEPDAGIKILLVIRKINSL